MGLLQTPATGDAVVPRQQGPLKLKLNAGGVVGICYLTSPLPGPKATMVPST